MEYKQVNRRVFVVVACCLGIYLCLAENFFATQPVSRKQSLSTLKQDIGQMLAELLDKSIVLIKLKATVQQELYNRIKELTEDNKKSYLVKSNSRSELCSYKERLKDYNQQWDKQIQELNTLIGMLHNGFTSSSPVKK